MALRPQQIGPLLAVGLVVVVLVLVCVGALLGVMGSDTEEGVSGGQGPAGGEEASPDDPSEDGASGVTSYSSERGPSEEAAEILRSYEDQGDCLLREAGFIDLFGNAWTCTVQGPGWVEVCLVSGSEGVGVDGESDVRIIRMDAEEWERAYGQAAG